MTDIIAGILVLAGSAFVFIAGLGVYNLPDTLNRMHASTKAGTLGSILALVATALAFGREAEIAMVVVIVAFLLLTAPVSAHMIGRATVKLQREMKTRAEEQAAKRGDQGRSSS